MKIKAYFPESIWDGTTGDRDSNSNPLSYDSDPTNQDYDRLAAEIIAIENYIFGNVTPIDLPSFITFSISGQSQSLEVGTTISSGSHTFVWTDTFPASIAPNSIFITDLTNSTVLGTGIDDTGSQALDFPVPIVYDVPASHTWTISATNILTNLIPPKSFTVNWLYKVYYGISTNPILNESQIKALTPALQSSFAGTYSLAATGYKYFAFPNSYGSPSLFKNSLNQFPIDMAQVTDHSSYSNVANGYSYALVNITSNGITEQYRLYRSHFVLGAAIGIAVQ